jgi:MauM/NapG family ferredoxin protein
LKQSSWTYARRFSQSFCLAAFLWLFLQTEYRGIDQLPYPVSLLFRIDPLAALADFLAPGPFGWSILWPALVVLLLTSLFGRFFCGWVCPLGTTLDGLGRLVGRGRRAFSPGWRRTKYYLLIGLGAATLCGVQLLGLFDPLAIFLRSLTLAVYPAYNYGLNKVFDFFYAHDVPLASAMVKASYPVFRDYLMAFHQPVFALGLFTLLIFLVIVLLERVEHRFWCKNLCPLGGLLGLCSRYAILQRTPQRLCADCQACDSLCRSGAVRNAGLLRSECLLCMDCTGYCPEERVTFGLRRGAAHDPGVDLQRRGMLTAVASGVMIAPAVHIGPVTYEQNPYLIRPPGAVAEEAFLQRCVRCAECMKVCIGRTLQPALLEAGPVGLWTPLVVPRIGYCEYNCTLCGQVCPTGAIAPLQLTEKQKNVIGLAVIKKDRCLPFAKGIECLVCEEHCPTGEKAIVMEEQDVLVSGELRRLKLPRVVDKLCIGCGICETKCPVEGASAIRVINEGESRRKRSALPAGAYG